MLNGPRCWIQQILKYLFKYVEKIKKLKEIIQSMKKYGISKEKYKLLYNANPRAEIITKSFAIMAQDQIGDGKEPVNVKRKQ